MAEVPTFVIVVAAALIAPDGRILLHKRRAGTNHGGLWEFPGGKLEHAESPESALVRELHEELGIRISASECLPVGLAVEESNPGMPRSPIAIFLYICRKWSGEVHCLEGEAIGWFAPIEIADLAMPPLDVPLAAQLLRVLDTKPI